MEDSIGRKDFGSHLMQFNDLQLSEKSGFFTFYFKLFFSIFKLFDHLKKTNKTTQLNNYDSDPLSFKWKKQTTPNYDKPFITNQLMTHH